MELNENELKDKVLKLMLENEALTSENEELLYQLEQKDDLLYRYRSLVDTLAHHANMSVAAIKEFNKKTGEDEEAA